MRRVAQRAAVLDGLLPGRGHGAVEHGLGQPGEQPTRPDEIHPLRTGTVDELLGKLLLINPSRQGLHRPSDTPSSTTTAGWGLK